MGFFKNQTPNKIVISKTNGTQLQIANIGHMNSEQDWEKIIKDKAIDALEWRMVAKINFIQFKKWKII